VSEVSVKCDHCGEEFLRRLGEHNRAVKRGYQQFCSKPCSNKGKDPVTNLKGKPENLKVGSQRDEYSPFRYFTAAIRRRHKSKGHKVSSQDKAVDLPYLKALWEDQEGKCAISGVELYLPASTTEWEGREITPRTASLDRIDSNKPALRTVKCKVRELYS